MDIATQTVLGAAVGEVVLGKKAGNKAILWGAVGGIIPDLDIFITPFFSDVDGLFVHRGFSHSLVFAFILAPILSWLVHKIHRKKSGISQFEWMKLIFMAAFTHPILDYLTTYGTGAFLPFSGYRVEFSTVAIVDVFYTIPLILVLVTIMFMNRASMLRRRLIVGVVILTTLYLAGTVGNKIYINSVFEKAFDKEKIDYNRYTTSPLPLSNFLWMGIAEAQGGYYVGLFSNFDNSKPSDFSYIPRNEALIENFSDDEELKNLIRFSKGYYHVGKDKDGLYLADLRFGKMGISENSDYVFKFYLVTSDGKLTIRQSERSRNVDGSDFAAFIQRIRGI